MGTLNFWDFTILIAYICLVVTVGIGVTWLQKRKATRLGTHDGSSFFLAAHTLPWPIIGLSLFSTNISTVHIVALAEQGYRTGLAFANFEIAAVFTLVLLAVFFVPFYLRSHITTLPDFLEQRFDRPCRDVLAFVSIISAIFIHIGVSLYAGAVVINLMLGLSTATPALFMTMTAIALITGLYVVIGGLLAVTVTDAIQTTTLILGSCVVTLVGMKTLGGWHVLHDTVGPSMLSLLRPTGDSSGLPWHAVLLGYPVIGIWYWCTDQTIVQRVLGAKNEDHGKAGALFAAFLKLLPMFIIVLPGVVCLALVNTGKLPPLADSKGAFSHLVMNLLPSGLRGLIVAGLLAALMGTIAGALNSIATLFSYDLYKRFRPETSEVKLTWIGRVVTLVSIVLSIIWSPIIGRFNSIFEAVSTMICYIAPPIAAVFTVGIFWKRATARAAHKTLWIGFMLGVTIFILDLWKVQTGWDMLFMHTAFFMFLACIGMMIAFSLAGPDENTELSRKLVWDSPLEPLRIPGARGLLNYKFLSCLVLTLAVLTYYLFRYPTVAEREAWRAAHPEAAAQMEAHSIQLITDH